MALRQPYADLVLVEIMVELEQLQQELAKENEPLESCQSLSCWRWTFQT